MKTSEQLRLSSLKFHNLGKPGKIGVSLLKPLNTQEDLSLAYSPGVAEPCKEIYKDPNNSWLYTNRSNLVAVITNGTAVLGLGAIGALAAKPVMEGKSALFKRFADIDSFDLNLDTTDVDEFVNSVKLMSGSFGGINLEDIRAPECFEIEERLIELMDIPVFHDDQHGTAIIASAGLLNACLLTNRKLEDIKVVFNGAGAAAISCYNMIIALGVKKENVFVCDSTGIIYSGRTENMNKYKQKLANKTELRTLEDIVKGADVLFGLSKKDAFSKDMIRKMNVEPIIFAMANPDPEILPYDVKEISKNAIVATGRSDFPNQVNNVICFPYIFRGALDVHARHINQEMKIATVKAIAELARQEVPDIVKSIYKNPELTLGRDYIIPTPFDPRLPYYIAPKVAEIAMKTGSARKNIDLEQYKQQIKERFSYLYDTNIA